MHSDPIADFVIRIKNGYMAHRKSVSAPYSKIKEEVGKILVREGFIAEMKHEGNILTAQLQYEEKMGAMKGVSRVSKPGLRVYSNKKKLPYVLQGYGIAIISTPEGLLTDREARKKGLGGEVMLKVW